jgi:thiol-disulfide isomerase/thioredoxin/outer membrane lipoprotein-sorting protein
MAINSIVFTILFLCNLFSFTSAPAQTPEQYLSAMKDSLSDIESFQYKALMRSKSTGSDEFKDRHFEVYARRNHLFNEANYRFDWQIVERRKDYTLIFFFINNDFFSVVSDKRFVLHNQNVYRLSQGEFFEAMRGLVFFDELTEDPDSLHKSKSKQFQETFTNGALLEINIQTFEAENKILCLNKKTLFPERVIHTYRPPALDMEQVFDVQLSEISLNTPLPDSVLSPQFYHGKGFDFVPPKPVTPRSGPLTEPVRDQKFATLLAQSPLIMATGDTTTLEKIEGELFLIDFWYLSCAPCLQALPYLQSLHEKYGAKGFKVIGINCQDIEYKSSAARKLKERGIDYPTYFIEKSYSRTLDIKAFPTLMLLNKNKEVIASGLGSIGNLEKLIEENLK